jgi:DinB superfamily
MNRTRPSMRPGLLAAALIVLAGALPVSGLAAQQQLTKEERDFLVRQLEESRAGLMKAVEGMSAAQWTWKPAPDRWSASEVAEHLLLTEGMLMGLLNDEVLKSPPQPEMRSMLAYKDGMLHQKLLDRSWKAQAPEPAQPKGAYPDEKLWMKAMNEARASTIKWVKATKDDLRSHVAPFAAFGPMDAYQWALVLPYHMQRHTMQIEEVKQAPGYPEK